MEVNNTGCIDWSKLTAKAIILYQHCFCYVFVMNKNRCGIRAEAFVLLGAGDDSEVKQGY